LRLDPVKKDGDQKEECDNNDREKITNLVEKDLLAEKNEKK
jgi:hypothetical protein